MDILDQILAADMAKQYTDSQKLADYKPAKILYEKHTPDAGGDGMTGWTEETGEYTTDFTIGKKYVVCLDSGTYETECRQGTEDGVNVYLGNGKLLSMMGVEGDYPDTGESFIVIIEMGVDRIAILDTNGGQSVVIKTLETIHPIDPKFLPGVCLPVVDIGDMSISSTPTTITDTTLLSTLEQLKKDRIPALLMTAGNPLRVATILTVQFFGDMCVYSGTIENTPFGIMYDNEKNVWEIGLYTE